MSSSISPARPMSTIYNPHLRYNMSSPCAAGNDSSIREVEKKILCLDFGENRVRAAVMTHPPTLEKLKAMRVVDFSSAKWFNENISSLFHRPEGLLQKCFGNQYSEISFGLTGPVLEGRWYLDVTKGIPFEIKKACEQKSLCPVAVENCTVTWAKGVAVLKRLISESIHYPCLGIALESTVGIVLMTAPNQFTVIELADLNWPFTHLRERSVEQLTNEKFGNESVNRLLGDNFCKWISRIGVNFEPDEIKEIYSDRLDGLLQDLTEYLSAEMGVILRSMVIGGKSSSLVRPDGLLLKSDVVLELISDKILSRYEISAESIPLLGCLESVQNGSVKMVPTAEQIWTSQLAKIKVSKED